jgi:hypothetical protein
LASGQPDKWNKKEKEKNGCRNGLGWNGQLKKAGFIN